MWITDYPLLSDLVDLDHITTPSPIYCLADVKMNHVRGSGTGAQIRASHSQSDPVSLGKTTPSGVVMCRPEKSPLCLDQFSTTTSYIWADFIYISPLNKTYMRPATQYLALLHAF